ncbi:Zn finger protein [Lithohypha guttulata]|nr:Zn finger protein [Lithohypha guttulata]
MATTTSHTYAIPQHSNQLHFHNNHGQPSPASSGSPASPRVGDMLHQQHYNPNPAKQLRPLKSPLYVPAVLRPTEHFPVLAPMTPPKSTRGLLEDLEEQNKAQLQQSDLDVYLSQMHADDEELGEVTGPPKQDHWKPDDASTSCDSPQCRSNFNLQYQRWDTARSMVRKDSNGSGSEDSKSYKSVPTLPQASGHRRMQSSAIATKGGQQQQQHASMANSVPKDWAWSTF